jgi:hypothetical protein
MSDNKLGDIVSVERARLIVKLRPDIEMRPALGDFVGIQLDGGRRLVGVVSGVVNRVKEELLPYMDSEKIPKFLPYVEDYAENLVVVTGLGTLSEKGPDYIEAVPVPLKAPVEKLGDEDIRSFHNKEGVYGAGYLFRHKEEISPPVGLRILEKLETLLPEEVEENIKAGKRFYEGGGFR